MEKFKSLKVGNAFVSTTSISKKELDEYLGFSRIKNAMFEIDSGKDEDRVISGRAIISRMEGEFTRLRQIYANAGRSQEPRAGHTAVHCCYPINANSSRHRL